MGISRRGMLATSAAFFLSACAKKTTHYPLGFRPNVIVFLSDALRADHLGCYGFRRPTSPFLDTFCAESLVYENCFAQGNWTRPSVASLFTGLMPRVHRATRSAGAGSAGARAYVLRESTPTLAEKLGRAGYATASFIANPHIQEKFGFTRGFQHQEHSTAMTPAGVVDRLTGWLDDLSGGPFFAYAHVLDPHGPYCHGEDHFHEMAGLGLEQSRRGLPEEDREIIDNFRGIYARRYAGEGVQHELDALSPEGLRHLRCRYAAEIPGVDRAFQRIYEYLERRRMLDQTVLIFTADHGEAFGEHGAFRHGDTLHAEETRVPLLVRVPSRQGRRIAPPVGQFDIHPTVLQLAGLAPSPGLQARGLFTPSGYGSSPAKRVVYTDQDLNTPVDFSWGISGVSGRWKVVSDPRVSGIQFYDLLEDPGEQRNLAAPGEGIPAACTELLRQLRKEKVRLWNLGEALGPPVEEAFSSEEEEALRALGYL